MPTYEYRCKNCGHELEVVQSFTDDPLETCPECEGALRKVYGNVGISFKGSGFYKNDARGSKKSTTPATSSSSDSTSTSTSASTSSDSSSSTTSDKKSTSTDKAGPAKTSSTTSKD